MTERTDDRSASFDIVLGHLDSPGVDAVALANRQSLLEALEDLVKGNDEPFWMLFDPDATFHEASCLPYGGAHKGIDAVKRAYQHMCSTYSGMRSVFHEVLTAGEYCILYQTITFTVAANGASGTLPVAELYRFRNGKIVEWRALYFDASQVAKAIAGS